eukprot:GHVN01006087.1.p1 GENE.GHVN01006087.1~~GHVN01006087.1.p1  ORF type:complete len:628 (-),score=91.14 GHVN01006087.1:436-2319(-)
MMEYVRYAAIVGLFCLTALNLISLLDVDLKHHAALIVYGTKASSPQPPQSSQAPHVANRLGVPRMFRNIHGAQSRVFLVSAIWTDDGSCALRVHQMYAFLELWRSIFHKNGNDECDDMVLTSLEDWGSHSSPFNVDDVIFVVNPECNRPFPSGCEVLNAVDSIYHTIDRLNLTSRLRQTEALRESKCFIIVTWVSSIETLPPWARGTGSFPLAVREPVVSAIVEQYDIVLSTSLPSIILPGVNLESKIPGKGDYGGREFFVSYDFHTTTSSKIGLRVFQKALNWENKNTGINDTKNIGSHWYGSSRDVIAAAEATYKALHLIANEDPFLKDTSNACNTWCQSDSPLYAAELGVNHALGYRSPIVTNDILHNPNQNAGIWGSKVISFQDPSSVSNYPAIIVQADYWYHMMFLTSDRLKNSSIEQRYERPNGTIDQLTLQELGVQVFFAATCRMNAEMLKAAKSEPASDPSENSLTRPTNNSHQSIDAEIYQIESTWFSCPRVIPYAYNYGERCCETKFNCRGTHLTEKDNCCTGESVDCLGKCKDDPQGPIPIFEVDSDIPVQSDRCPRSHPYPYLKGAHCCVIDRTCHFEPLDRDSPCCFHHRQVSCSLPPCGLYWDRRRGGWVGSK